MQAATGIVCSDDVINQFNEFKLKKLTGVKFITYKIDGANIVTDTVAEVDATFDSFISLLPENDCRYAVYDMSFETSDGRPGNKLVFIAW